MDIEDSVSASSMGENAQLKLDIREIDNDLKDLGLYLPHIPSNNKQLSSSILAVNDKTLSPRKRIDTFKSCTSN